MRLFKNNLSLLYPEGLYLCSKVNEDNTDGDIFEIEDVHRDRDCYFHALAKSLLIPFKDHLQLRAFFASKVLDCKEYIDVQKLCRAQLSENFETWAMKMGNQGT